MEVIEPGRELTYGLAEKKGNITHSTSVLDCCNKSFKYVLTGFQVYRSTFKGYQNK